MASVEPPTKKRKLIFLAGAPASDSLDWDEKHLLHDFSPLFRTLLDGQLPQRSLLADSSAGDGESSLLYGQTANKQLGGGLSTPVSKWRSISLQSAQHIPTGLTQDTQASFAEPEMSFREPALQRGGISFLTPTPLSFLDDTTSMTSLIEDESQEKSKLYLTHSFKLHQSTRSSHLDSTSFLRDTQEINTADTQLTTTDDTTSFGSSSILNATALDPSLPIINIPPSIKPTTIADLPSASHLLKISPHIPTPTLLVAVLSITPRTIQLRQKYHNNHHQRTNTQQTPPQRHLIELLLADHTRSCFRATFWLPPPPKSSTKTSSSTITTSSSPLNIPFAHLSSLKPGTILLIHQLMLTSYLSVTCGQNLNPRATGLSTRVDVLRDGEGITRARFSPTTSARWAERYDEVRAWVERFVGPALKDGGGRKAMVPEGKEEGLPPDSFME